MYKIIMVCACSGSYCTVELVDSNGNAFVLYF
jgi:hypothetical protein